MESRAMKILLCLLILFYCLACSSNKKTDVIINSNKFRLSNVEINRLIPLLDPIRNPKGNFHILYSEQINDSTGLIRIWQNQFLANKKLGVCEFLKYNGSN